MLLDSGSKGGLESQTSTRRRGLVGSAEIGDGNAETSVDCTPPKRCKETELKKLLIKLKDKGTVDKKNVR
ncbi:hypothetical protein L917_11518 [Phytophthora nicotianae]|uniref:Uncharacterized protein n=2 Tax=Phytophthora nicotianae TaxID=4792 RepID=W2Q234_PHYN3|nr:hypothetical protein PPTG_13666 [Phytophthora nicotianae INRA-310]ETL89579.1 hypothetical protein L917_11518 [Phytophthora nicotianae]ETN06310.1 hypothetical protein PPTG_13666 [Phytophthora nicotianae INRA-310]